MSTLSAPILLSRRAVTTIALTALLEGTSDAAAAIGAYPIVGGKTPSAIFRFIASGAFGWK